MNIISRLRVMKKEIIRLKIFFFAIFFFFFHKLKHQSPRIVKNIVIIQLAKLGDMVCTTPMFRAVKNKYPDCHLTVMGNNVNGELLRYNKDVDEYLVWDNEGFQSNIDSIKKRNFDFGCVTSPNFEGLAALFLAKVPFVTAPRIENGWSPYETRSYRFLRKLFVAVPHRMHSYAPLEYLRLLEPINIYTNDTAKHLGFSDVASEQAKRFFVANGIDVDSDFVVGISPTAGNKIKEWPVERFAQVADYLVEKYNAKVVVVGGAGDLTKTQEMISFLDKKTTIANAAGVFDLDGLKAFISKLSMLVCVDTGPIYIAEAFNISTVDITGPIDEKEQPPRGLLHRNVVPPERIGPELFVLNARV